MMTYQCSGLAPAPDKDTNRQNKLYRASLTFGLLQMIYHGCTAKPSGLLRILQRSELCPDSYVLTRTSTLDLASISLRLVPVGCRIVVSQFFDEAGCDMHHEYVLNASQCVNTSIIRLSLCCYS